MNEELQAKMIKYFGGLENAVEKTMDFTVEQAPLVVQDIITWGIVSSLITVALLILLIVVSRFLIKKLVAIVVEGVQEEDKKFAAVAIWGIYCVLAAIPTTISIQESLTAAKAYFAPRLYVLEEIKDFVNDSK